MFEDGKVGGRMADGGDRQTRDQELNRLNASLPRKVWMSDNASPLFLWAVMLILGGVIWFAVYYHFASEHIQQREILRREGRAALADVTAKGTSRSGVSIHYTFKVDGLPYQATAFLPDDRRIDPNVGAQIPIRYLPSDPSISHPSKWEWSAESDIVPDLFMIFFPGLGVTALVFLFREREFARKGWAVEGRVTGCTRRGPRFSVYYEFHTGTGSLIEGSNDSYPDEYEYDSRVPIIYMRNNPKRNSLYPPVYYHVQ
jgi:hypothetical protein